MFNINDMNNKLKKTSVAARASHRGQVDYLKGLSPVMGSLKNMKSWYALFFASFRRQPSARQYRYKDNVPTIRNTVLRKFRSRFRDSELNTVSIPCTRALELWSLGSVQKLLVSDIQASFKGASGLQLIRVSPRSAAEEENLSIAKWAEVAPIFSTPLLRLYGPVSGDHFGTSGREGEAPLEFQYAIKLMSKDGSKELGFVSWPDPAYSLSCQGLGVSAETFKYLNGAEFVNPVDNSPLNVYEVDFVPKDSNGIGLFPAFVDSHRVLFTGLQLCGSLIRRKLCSGQSKHRVNNLLTRMPREQANELPLDSSSNDFFGECSFANLKALMNRTKKYKLLWSTGKDRSKICPGDIIRSCLASRRVTNAQLEEEFCKHYILFSLFSQTLRIQEYLEKEKIDLGESSLNLNVCDSFIWEKFRAVNTIGEPSNIQELIEFKSRYDDFLGFLTSYYFSLIAEMKASTAEFYAGGAQSRALTVYMLLNTILRDCKLIKMFSPNLSTYVDEKLPQLPKEPELDSRIAGISDNTGVGSKVSSIITNCIELEHLMYSDNFSTDAPIQLEPVAPTSDWKLVIMSKQELPPDMTRLVKFNSKVHTQFVADLADVSRNSFSICKAKKMIDQNLFIFLYKLERPRRISREDLISDIIDKLEDASALPTKSVAAR
ncbi:hypothetical protein HG535_0H03700 [Zygotorulaspora mrakii]|uniref:Uncharacterized protein n=1 Tax=Zygotorulaspora mrakii TaxID=42260 RepID=A0A7H9B931_ZYGMR|nr:uncharacterized protein HG535_0H03700 [Zygotorulaspora mrakii]QLG75043.1 hypothetical protein HG535_0H03700 [Zygotorulaspora mrakii]